MQFDHDPIGVPMFSPEFTGSKKRPFLSCEHRMAIIEAKMQSPPKWLEIRSEAFTPDAEILPSLGTLMELATDIDPERAAKKWRSDPPDEDYEAILDAEEAEESDDDG